MKARLLFVPAILLAMLCMTPAVSDATILIKKDLAQLAAESELVVVAEVGGHTCAHAPGTKLIFTYTNIVVEKTLKGKAPASMIVAEIGGKLGDITLKVASMPRFTEGERVLLFLKKDALGQQRVHGAIQGRFKVVYNRATDEETVLFDRGLRHVTNRFFATPRDLSPTSVSIDEFEAKVSDLVKAAAKRAAMTEEVK